MKNNGNPISNIDLHSAIKHLGQKDRLIRHQARWDLIKAGPQSIPYLAEVVNNNTPSLARKEAIKALGEIDDPDAVSILVSALEDDSYDVRWDAAVGLIEHGEGSLGPLFEALKTNFGSPTLREGAHHVLRILRKKMVNKHIEAVYDALESIAPEVEVPWIVTRELTHMQSE